MLDILGYPAMVILFASMWLYKQPNLWGPALGCGSCALWIMYGAALRDLPIMFTNIVLLVIHLKNFKEV